MAPSNGIGMSLVRPKGNGEAVAQSDVELFDASHPETVSDWQPSENNNVKGNFGQVNGLLTMSYVNDPSQKAMFSYVLGLEEPLPNVGALKFRWRAERGTAVTVDVVRAGALVEPRYLSFHPGTGDWEEITVPVGGQLDSVTIGIGERDVEAVSSQRQVEVQWVKAIGE